MRRQREATDLLSIVINVEPRRRRDRLQPNDRLWHDSEVAERSDYVCSLGKSGLNMLSASLTGLTPTGHSKHSLDLPIGLSHRPRDGSVVSSPPLHE
jgi:hypothetical protein